MSKLKTIKVRLRRGHPNRVMLARLSDDTVVQIGEDGVDIEPGLVSREMRRCGWFDGCDGAAEPGELESDSIDQGYEVEQDDLDGDAGEIDHSGDEENVEDPATEELSDEDPAVDTAELEPGLKADEQPSAGRLTKAEKQALKDVEKAKAKEKPKAKTAAAKRGK